jgi:multisubunit Na+/H+ antiporter MnhB subunit
MNQSAPPKEDNLKTYLDYLDKEMTIMGILSTFCILTMGFVAEKLFFPDKESAYKFWQTVNILCMLGLSGLLFAALAFYRQRSLLAWFYGQLSLYKAKGDDAEVKKLLDESDSWYHWKWYQTGFGSLAFAFFELGAVGLSGVHPFVAKCEPYIAIGILLVCGIGTAFFVIAYDRYPYEEKPLTKLWRAIFRLK